MRGVEFRDAVWPVHVPGSTAVVCVTCNAAAAAAASCECLALGSLFAGQLDLNMSKCVLFWSAQ